jgi:hypothetical protein
MIMMSTDYLDEMSSAMPMHAVRGACFGRGDRRVSAMTPWVIFAIYEHDDNKRTGVRCPFLGHNALQNRPDFLQPALRFNTISLE